MICFRGFLLLAFTDPSTARQRYRFWSAPSILFPRYPPYLASVPPSATRGGTRWENSNSTRGEITISHHYLSRYITQPYNNKEELLFLTLVVVIMDFVDKLIKLPNLTRQTRNMFGYLLQANNSSCLKRQLLSCRSK